MRIAIVIACVLASSAQAQVQNKPPPLVGECLIWVPCSGPPPYNKWCELNAIKPIWRYLTRVRHDRADQEEAANGYEFRVAGPWGMERDDMQYYRKPNPDFQKYQIETCPAAQIKDYE